MIRSMSKQPLFSSVRTDWGTPQGFFDALNEEFHFTLDVCASNGNAKVVNYHASEELTSALAKPWDGVCWCNPPYGRTIGQWMQKAWESSLRGATVVCLIPARTDTTWWHDYVMLAAEIRFIRGRLRFDDGGGTATFPSVVVIFRGRTGDG